MATSTALAYSPATNFGSGFTSGSDVQQILTDTNKTKIYYTGSFNSYKNATQNEVSVQDYFGNLISGFDIGTGPNNTISAMRLQSDGKLLLGGSFTTFNGSTQYRLIRLNSDGSKDSTFDIGPTGINQGGVSFGTVFDIQIQVDNKILVIGQFNSYSGVSIPSGIVRLNSDATIDTDFTNNLGTGFSNTALVCSIQTDGKIVVGGSFSRFSGVVYNGIIRLNSDGTVDNTFNSQSFNNGGGPQNNGLAIQSDGKILASGGFSTYSGVSNIGVVRINTDGTRDSTFNSGGTFFNSATFPPRVVKLQPDGKIMLGGLFTSYNGVSANKILRLNSDGTRDTSFGNPSGSITQIYDFLINSDGTMYVVGSFNSYSGFTIGNVIKLNSNGSVYTGATQITGTQLIGNLAVATASTVNYNSSTNGGVTFWMGPDQDLGYVIGIPVPEGNQPTPISGVTAFLGFNRSSALTESAFVSMVNYSLNQNFTGGTQAKTYLNNNGYWTSY